MKGLIKIVQKLLKSMLSETEKCPSQIRQVFEYMSEETVKKWPQENTSNIVGSIFYLRCICPALVTPSYYGLVDKDEPLSRETERGLVLIAKIVQNVANGNFLVPEQPYADIINELITQNISLNKSFFDFLTTAEKQATLRGFFQRNSLVTKNLETTLEKIADAMIEKRGKILLLVPEENRTKPSTVEVFKTLDFLAMTSQKPGTEVEETAEMDWKEFLNVDEKNDLPSVEKEEISLSEFFKMEQIRMSETDSTWYHGPNSVQFKPEIVKPNNRLSNLKDKFMKSRASSSSKLHEKKPHFNQMVENVKI